MLAVQGRPETLRTHLLASSSHSWSQQKDHVQPHHLPTPAIELLDEQTSSILIHQLQSIYLEQPVHEEMSGWSEKEVVELSSTPPPPIFNSSNTTNKVKSRSKFHPRHRTITNTHPTHAPSGIRQKQFEAPTLHREWRVSSSVMDSEDGGPAQRKVRRKRPNTSQNYSANTSSSSFSLSQSYASASSPRPSTSLASVHGSIQRSIHGGSSPILRRRRRRKDKSLVTAQERMLLTTVIDDIPWGVRQNAVAIIDWSVDGVSNSNDNNHPSSRFAKTKTRTFRATTNSNLSERYKEMQRAAKKQRSTQRKTSKKISTRGKERLVQHQQQGQRELLRRNVSRVHLMVTARSYIGLPTATPTANHVNDRKMVMETYDSPTRVSARAATTMMSLNERSAEDVPAFKAPEFRWDPRESMKKGERGYESRLNQNQHSKDPDYLDLTLLSLQ